jgi:hypothetical protein
LIDGVEIHVVGLQDKLIAGNIKDAEVVDASENHAVGAVSELNKKGVSAMVTSLS